MFDVRYSLLSIAILMIRFKAVSGSYRGNCMRIVASTMESVARTLRIKERGGAGAYEREDTDLCQVSKRVGRVAATCEMLCRRQALARAFASRYQGIQLL